MNDESSHSQEKQRLQDVRNVPKIIQLVSDRNEGLNLGFCGSKLHLVFYVSCTN